MKFERYAQIAKAVKRYDPNSVRAGLRIAIENEEIGAMQGVPLSEADNHAAFVDELRLALQISEAGNRIMQTGDYKPSCIFDMALSEAQS